MPQPDLTRYQSADDAGRRLGLTRNALIYYLRTGRIKGALKWQPPYGGHAVWLVPRSAVLPERRKPGRPRGKPAIPRL